MLVIIFNGNGSAIVDTATGTQVYLTYVNVESVVIATTAFSPQVKGGDNRGSAAGDLFRARPVAQVDLALFQFANHFGSVPDRGSSDEDGFSDADPFAEILGQRWPRGKMRSHGYGARPHGEEQRDALKRAENSGLDALLGVPQGQKV